MFFSLIIDKKGNCIGSHSYQEKPETYPPNEIPCNAKQAFEPEKYIVSGSKIVKSNSKG